MDDREAIESYWATVWFQMDGPETLHQIAASVCREAAAARREAEVAELRRLFEL